VRKPLITIVLVCLLVASACSSDSKPKASSSSSAGTAAAFTPMKSGVLTVGTELPAPPFWIGDDYNSLTGGFEYDLSQAIAKELGLSKTVIIEMPFAGLVAGQECPCDVDFSQVTANADRRNIVDFTDPYFGADLGILVKKGKSVKTLADAQALQWGVQVNTTSLDFVDKTIKPTKRSQVYNTTVDAFNALDAGQVDAVLLDTPIVLGEAKSATQFEVVAQFKTGENYGGVVKKGSANLAAINATLAKLKDNGTLSALVTKYFGADPTNIPVIAVN
jgi:polar amino acid transport system substrate-binding protein